MKISRREFLIVSGAVVANGCQTTRERGHTERRRLPQVVNAGPVADYAADGVYAGFREQGFFIIRRDGKLFALSSVCTHKRCLLNPEPDRSFSCPCHGSAFDPDGHVTEGPARRDLPVLATSIDENRELLVSLPRVRE